FAGAREKPVAAVVRRAQRLRLPDRPGPGQAAYHFESLDFPATERRFNSYFAEFHISAHDASRAHAHPGAELVYALTGTLVLRIGDDEYRLDAGDSIYFDSSVPHTYWRDGDAPCTGVVVTSA
ncbi:MAG: HTH-type transcriptional regulator PuuR, partial [Actinomycetota bacterium]